MADSHDGDDVPAASGSSPTERLQPFSPLQLRFKRRKRANNASDQDQERIVRGPLGLTLVHASPEPLVDVIFVHGLNGDSVKTWRKGREMTNFWPRYWLPMDPDFRHASIHSFGYECDWKDPKSSILDVFDFGNSLHEALRTSPHLRARPKTPILLIGHSMGGLVIKKAYNTAREDEQHPELAKRMQCMFFLATPHRGSNYAGILNNILKISGLASPKQFLGDLKNGSKATQLINQDFTKFANELSIFSFFETLQMDVKVSAVFVVSKKSAVLGPEFTTERVQHLDASHQDMCKFESPSDPNYIRLRNSLSAAVEDLLHRAKTTHDEEARSQLRLLQTFLDVNGTPDLVDIGCQGSCRWIEERGDFKSWREPSNSHNSEPRPSYFIVTASPGAGKTVLAAHVASQLQHSDMECAFHSFGVQGSQSLGALLRSLAYQMATNTSVAREVLVELYNRGSPFDTDDARVIWNKLFMRGIFQERIASPQYWVIDAVDECAGYRELFAMLAQAKPRFVLRVFITSRTLPNMRKLLEALNPNVQSLSIPKSDTLKDISAYIRTRVDCFNVETESEKTELSEKVVSKSDASFLWVRLVLDELERVYGYESIAEVLEEIPESMVPFYQRSATLLREKREQNTIKAILAWVVASIRPLHVTELSQALHLDLKVQLPSNMIRTAIEGLCSNFVFVDTNDTIRLVHITAREFLLSEAAGEFRVEKSLAHERIALSCLKLLSSRELQLPKHRRYLNQGRPSPTALSAYAKKHFSKHVFATSPEKDDLCIALDRFLRHYVLSWVEHLARCGDLHSITRTARDLKGFLNRTIDNRSTLNRELEFIGRWATDLTRVVARFGNALLVSPAAIYFQIPPLAPVDSALAQFGASPDGLTLVGHRDTAWPDCIASIRLGKDITTAVACGSNLIAVGTLSGTVGVYDDHTLEEVDILGSPFAAQHAHFDQSGKYLAISSIRQLSVWDLTGNKVWEVELRHALVLLDSTHDSILGLTSRGHLRYWKTASGDLLRESVYPSDPQSRLSKTPPPYKNKAPSVAAVSPDGQTMAVAYGNQPIRIWSLYADGEEDAARLQITDFIGYAVDDKDRRPVTMIFNPNSNVDMFLVGYEDCHLALFDSNSGTLLQSEGENSLAGLLSITSSADGRTFATVDSKGCMCIRDFESLHLLYHVTSYNTLSRILRFTSGSSAIIDVADEYMRAWSPVVLVRGTIDEPESAIERVPETAVVEGQYEVIRDSRISALCAHSNGHVIFVGRDDGRIAQYDGVTGKHEGAIYSHANHAPITAMAVSGANFLASGDILGNLRIWRFSSESRERPGQVQQQEGLLLKARYSKNVRQIIFAPGDEYILASTAAKDELLLVESGSIVRSVSSLTFSTGDRKPWKWLVNPASAPDEPQLYLVQDKTLRLFDVKTFGSNKGAIVGVLDYEMPSETEETDIVSAAIFPASQILVLDTRRKCRSITLPCLLLFSLEPLANLQSPPPYIKPLAMPDLLTARVRQVITMPTSGKRHLELLSQRQPSDPLFFLDQDSWLCSLDLQTMRPISTASTASYNRHFYVPTGFVTQQGGEVLPLRTVDDDIVFSVHDEIAIIKNGLKFQESQAL